jgi:hypothetical protein
MLKIILICIFILFLSFLSANRIELSFLNRKDVLQKLESCHLPKIKFLPKRIIKPTWGSHNGKGVDFESETWNTTICENTVGVPCFSQIYHPGPWEGRITREKNHWKTVAWKVPWLDTQTEPPAFETTFPWENQLKECIETIFPETNFLAIDFRTNGFDILPLEINGAYGLTYDFVLDKQNVIIELLHWILLRSLYGFYNMDLWIFRLVQNIQLWFHKWKTRRVPSRVWF